MIQDAEATTVLSRGDLIAMDPTSIPPSGNLEFTQPENGQLELTDSIGLQYTPDPGFVGKDAFTYTLGDNDPVTFEIHVWESLYAVPDWFQVAPNASTQSLDVIGNDYVFSKPAASGNSNDSLLWYSYWNQDRYAWRNDPTGLTIVSAASSDGGTVTVENNALSYAPAAGFVGEESLTYVIEDELGHQSQATVTIEVSDATPGDYFVSESEFLHNQIDQWMQSHAGSLNDNDQGFFRIEIGEDFLNGQALLPFAADLADSRSAFGSIREVQEGDIVKSNGNFIYYVTNEIDQFDWLRFSDDVFVADEVNHLYESYLTIVDVTDASNPIVASTTGFDEHISNVFLGDDRIALVGVKMN